MIFQHLGFFLSFAFLYAFACSNFVLWLSFFCAAFSASAISFLAPVEQELYLLKETSDISSTTLAIIIISNQNDSALCQMSNTQSHGHPVLVNHDKGRVQKKKK